jgi:hypothetical protein
MREFAAISRLHKGLAGETKGVAAVASSEDSKPQQLPKA